MAKVTFRGLKNLLQRAKGLQDAPEDPTKCPVKYSAGEPQLQELEEVTLSDVREGMKVLAVAIRKKIPIRYGCASARCGSCAVRVVSGELSAMEGEEKQLLERLRIYQGEEVRLSCRARMREGDVCIDLAFQDTYDPADAGFDPSVVKYRG